MRLEDKNICQKPERGYYCTWAEGHLGECDVWPEWWMELWFSIARLWRK